jgi:hypothetical protein
MLVEQVALDRGSHLQLAQKLIALVARRSMSAISLTAGAILVEKPKLRIPFPAGAWGGS